MDISAEIAKRDGRTKGQFERNYYDKLREMNTAKSENDTLKIATIGAELLRDQIVHDHLQKSTIGYGEGAPTHYEATLAMIRRVYFPQNISSGFNLTKETKQVKMKYTHRKATKKEPYWWNWDAGKNFKNIRIISLEVIIEPVGQRKGICLTIWRHQWAITW